MNDDYYCTACGSFVRSQTITNGSFATELILWLFFLLPGLIYSCWRLTTRHEGCPECGSPDIIPSHTPRAQQALAAQQAIDASETMP